MRTTADRPGILRGSTEAFAAVTAISWAGLLVHNSREFGLSATLDLTTGSLPMGLLALAMAISWWRQAVARKLVAALAVAVGLIHLLFGGVVSALPLAVLPFTPEQSVAHYLSHLVYSVAQLPLIWFAVRSLRHWQAGG